MFTQRIFNQIGLVSILLFLFSSFTASGADGYSFTLGAVKPKVTSGNGNFDGSCTVVMTRAPRAGYVELTTENEQNLASVSINLPTFTIGKGKNKQEVGDITGKLQDPRVNGSFTLVATFKDYSHNVIDTKSKPVNIGGLAGCIPGYMVKFINFGRRKEKAPYSWGADIQITLLIDTQYMRENTTLTKNDFELSVQMTCQNCTGDTTVGQPGPVTNKIFHVEGGYTPNTGNCKIYFLSCIYVSNTLLECRDYPSPYTFRSEVDE